MGDFGLFLLVLLCAMCGSMEGSICRIKTVERKVTLDCSRKNITKLNLDLSGRWLSNVTELDFSHNNIRQLRKNDFKGFPNVEILRLSWNQLTVGTLKRRVFFYLPKLRELYLDHNQLRRIPGKVFTSTHQLTKLDLDANQIFNIPNNVFRRLSRLKVLRIRYNVILNASDRAFRGLERSLRRLNLKNNSLTAIPWKAFRLLKNLEFIELSNNKIKEIAEKSFAGLSSLEEFRLLGQTLASSHDRVKVHRNAFRKLKSLRLLNLDFDNIKLDSFPVLDGTDKINDIRLRNIKHLTIPDVFCSKKRQLEKIRIRNSIIHTFPKLSRCKSLRKIDLISNTISFISRHAFNGLRHVTHIDIFQKHNTVQKIDTNAFQNLPSLKELDLSHYPLNNFPNFNNTRNIRKLKLQFCNITRLPSHLCNFFPNLQNLDLSQNVISTLPRFSRCEKLKNVDLFQNRIRHISSQFSNLRELEMVRLSDNHIRSVERDAFKRSPLITKLYLDWNMIETIDDNAFKDIQNLELLNISVNRIRKLPSKGLRSLVVIDANNNPELRTFPPVDEVPFLRQLRLTYQYHCCFFKERVRALQQAVLNQQFYSNSSWVVESSGDYTNIMQIFNATHEREIEAHKMEPLLRQLNNNSDKLYFIPEQSQRNLYIYKGMKGRFISVNSYCIPEPNDFYPCDDLMGREWLRCCVWVVVFLAVVGNVFVLIVLTANYARLDVPRFLIINLAFADLCLGIYLAFLAFVDLLTLGKFKMFGLEWQFSASCRTAGFLAVFASELSVYTLSAMTIERFTTIKNSMHVEKRITKKQAIVIMAVGWIFSTILAMLPLYTNDSVKFSDYSKYSVCLPFEVETLTSKVYVSFILIFNMIAFLVILGCYIKIYLFISGSHAWNSGDARVARRMAILVFTDFLCWFPIVLIALSAVYDNSLVKDLWISKVLTIFVFPLNACSNPLLYSILTKQFRKDIMVFVRHVKGKSMQRDIRKSLFKSNTNQSFKNSLTYSTSMRRGSSFSFLFSRRCSSKTDDIKLNARIIPVQELPSTTPTKEVENSIEENPLEEMLDETMLPMNMSMRLPSQKDSGISLDKDLDEEMFTESFRKESDDSVHTVDPLLKGTDAHPEKGDGGEQGVGEGEGIFDEQGKRRGDCELSTSL